MRDSRSEECRQDVSNKSTDSVYGEDVESIVTSEEVLELRGIVARHSSADTENDGCPSRYETRARRDAHEAGNNTRAEADR